MTGAVRPAASGRSWQFPGSWLAQTTQRRGPGQYANVKRFSASPPVADVVGVAGDGAAEVLRRPRGGDATEARARRNRRTAEWSVPPRHRRR